LNVVEIDPQTCFLSFLSVYVIVGRLGLFTSIFRFALYFAHLLFNQFTIESLQINTFISMDIPLSIRTIAIAYKFDLHLRESEIATRLSVQERTLRKIFKRAKERAQSNEWRELLLYIENQPGRGRKPYIQPGSLESVAIRETIRTLDRYEATLLANIAKERPVLKELHPNIPHLKPPQVYNVLRDKRHCEMDPIDTALVKRLKPIHKLGGYEATTRLNYT
jgi:hypothetical protein